MRTGQPQSLLETELWSRRQDRRDAMMADDAVPADALLVPLILALARLGAQRDAAHLMASDPLDEGALR